MGSKMKSYYEYFKQGIDEGFGDIVQAEKARVRNQNLQPESSEFKLNQARRSYSLAKHHSSLANFHAKAGDTEKALHHQTTSENHMNEYHSVMKELSVG